jgi:hypothetical protein
MGRDHGVEWVLLRLYCPERGTCWLHRIGRLSVGENHVVEWQSPFWVTGAGQGIGRGIALRLAKEGADLALADVKAR